MKAVCQLCGFIYDDANEAVPFAELPDDWCCPCCGAPKEFFEVEAAPAEETAPVADAAAETVRVAADAEGDVMAGLSAGQVAALCGNLARGCEKQNLPRESALFAQLAESFTAQVEPIDGADIQGLADLLMGDTGRYAAAKSAAKAAGDRGSLRALTWGERITNMLSYLVGRYLKEGEAFLEGTEVWVCTACGFIYVGDEAPELCPVCKVPSWKFEKMEVRTS